MMNDFWPIRSQCTKIRLDSLDSSSSEGNDNRLKPGTEGKESREENKVLIDYDDAEHWWWISEHEQLFSQSFDFDNNNSQDNQNLKDESRRDWKPNNARNIQLTPPGNARPNACSRCISKFWKWALDNLLKNL